MKRRTKWVSNSSSSSYFVAFEPDLLREDWTSEPCKECGRRSSENALRELLELAAQEIYHSGEATRCSDTTVQTIERLNEYLSWADGLPQPEIIKMLHLLMNEDLKGREIQISYHDHHGADLMEQVKKMKEVHIFDPEA